MVMLIDSRDDNDNVTYSIRIRICICIRITFVFVFISISMLKIPMEQRSDRVNEPPHKCECLINENALLLLLNISYFCGRSRKYRLLQVLGLLHSAPHCVRRK
jgi:hypothetical protein